MFKVTTTVDGVLKEFYKVVARLDDVINHHQERSTKESELINELRDSIDNHKTEVARASKVKKALSDLIG